MHLVLSVQLLLVENDWDAADQDGVEHALASCSVPGGLQAKGCARVGLLCRHTQASKTANHWSAKQTTASVSVFRLDTESKGMRRGTNSERCSASLSCTAPDLSHHPTWSPQLLLWVIPITDSKSTETLALSGGAPRSPSVY